MRTDKFIFLALRSLRTLTSARAAEKMKMAASQRADGGASIMYQ